MFKSERLQHSDKFFYLIGENGPVDTQVVTRAAGLSDDNYKELSQMTNYTNVLDSLEQTVTFY